MQQTRPLSIVNIALIGGDAFCKEVLEKIISEYNRDVNAHVVALAHPDSHAPGRVFAEKIGLKTFNDYHDLYAPEHDVDLLAVLTPSQHILEDILATKPAHIRLLSYQTFKLFWDAIAGRAKEMETVLNGIQENILVIAPDMTIVDVNESFLAQMDYSREEVIGRKCHEVFQQKNHICSNNIHCPLKKAIGSKGPNQSIMQRLGSDGEVRYIEVTIYPIWEAPGKLAKFIEISRDITQRKREEEEITHRLEMMVEERTKELKKTHEKLLHQDKMASLGKLSASVVHEINNPIAGILNLILLIKRIFNENAALEDDAASITKYLDLMETETRRISRIVTNLLSFSRQSKIELGDLDLNQLINKVLLLNENLIKLNQIHVVQQLSQDLPTLYGSEDQLLQVFMNLISNAVEAMATTTDKTLTVTTKKSETRNTLEVNISDTGVGIPESSQGKIYEPFYTTKKKGKGVGLGLSVVYGIIQEHKGAIKVSSRPDSGTSFVISLPI